MVTETRREAVTAVVDPRTGRPVGEVALLSAADVPRVARTAAAAAPGWAGTTVDHRARKIRDLADALARRLPGLAPRFSQEHGKTPAEAMAELERAVETLRWSADAALEVSRPTSLPERGGIAREVVVDPAGPVLAIVPWNFPAVVLARKLGPALAMGCSVVVKGPEEVPCVPAAMARAAAEAGLPDGLVQVVHAAPADAEALVRRPEFRRVTFTGSTRVGRLVAAAAAEQLTPCVLELGGHAPVIVTDDADLDAAVDALAIAKFGSTGQSCGAPSRFIVQERVADDFVRRLVRRAPAPDSEPGGTMGPLNNARRRDAVHSLVEDAVRGGARLVLGGRIPDTPGFHYPATVLCDVPPQARILHEEPFGPVAPVMRYRDDAEALTLANSSAYALSAYVYGEPGRARELAGLLDAGSVGVNCSPGAAPDAPLGGRAASGYGYEGGVQGLLSFGALKVVQHLARPTSDAP
ncbi:aldehyde dehydrogenase family protein [Streptomyces cyaneus]|uniref:aldehyde dehydrogenase family protein n=1 Tax=Streptomyces cyaneus TaxID=1904 RepID=UPI000FF8B3A6|nr:aldehyde dehydrogenase family protein [Streptomyces cyaneus]